MTGGFRSRIDPSSSPPPLQSAVPLEVVVLEAVVESGSSSPAPMPKSENSVVIAEVEVKQRFQIDHLPRSAVEPLMVGMQIKKQKVE